MQKMPFLEALRKHLSNRLPFVAYRKPDEKKVFAFLQESDELELVEDFSESGFVFAPFDGKKPALLIPEKASENVVFEPEEDQEVRQNFSDIVGFPKASEGAREKHLALVQKALEKLQKGELEKVVLSRKEAVALKGRQPIELFEELLNSYPTAFVYIFFHPKAGLWLGATPETLLKVEGRDFKTMALAGTRKYDGTTDVQWGQKEIQEQKFVTDSILESLKNTGVTSGTSADFDRVSLQNSESYTSRAGNLLHLRTDISGRLRDENHLKKVVQALHPTPAVCGLPKEKAKEFILTEENYDREFYTGFLGELNLQKSNSRSRHRRNVENLAYRTVKKETALFVNLRCMKIEDDRSFVFVGGGITRDSNPEAEWEETVNKSQTMKKVLLKQ